MNKLQIKNVPENKEYMISYYDTCHYLNEKDFIQVAKQFMAGKKVVMLEKERKLLTNKFIWAGKITDDIFKKPERMSKKEFAEIEAERIRKKYGLE